MVAIPLIITSLISGVMGLGNASQLGRMFGRTLSYYVCTSMLAIVTGLLMVNLIRPGLGGSMNFAGGEKPEVSAQLGSVLFEQVETMIPPNPFAALAEGDFLSIICFSLAFAVFAILVGGKTAERLRDFFNDGFQVMMSMTMAIIRLAPLGRAVPDAVRHGDARAEVFKSLAWYMLTVLLALATHALIMLPLIVKFVAKRNPLEFAQAMSPALLTAFSSASSNGTLPLTLACVEERAKISNRVSSFVLPLGATVNMDGTALYEAVAVLFIAQLHFGANLPLDPADHRGHHRAAGQHRSRRHSPCRPGDDGDHPAGRGLAGAKCRASSSPSTASWTCAARASTSGATPAAVPSSLGSKPRVA